MSKKINAAESLWCEGAEQLRQAKCPIGPKITLVNSKI